MTRFTYFYLRAFKTRLWLILVKSSPKLIFVNTYQIYIFTFPAKLLLLFEKTKNGPLKKHFCWGSAFVFPRVHPFAYIFLFGIRCMSQEAMFLRSFSNKYEQIRSFLKYFDFKCSNKCSKMHYLVILGGYFDTWHPRFSGKKLLQLLVWDLICNFWSQIGKSIPTSFTNKDVI